MGLPSWSVRRMLLNGSIVPVLYGVYRAHTHRGSPGLEWPSSRQGYQCRTRSTGYGIEDGSDIDWTWLTYWRRSPSSRTGGSTTERSNAPRTPSAVRGYESTAGPSSSSRVSRSRSKPGCRGRGRSPKPCERRPDPTLRGIPPGHARRSRSTLSPSNTSTKRVVSGARPTRIPSGRRKSGMTPRRARSSQSRTASG